MRLQRLKIHNYRSIRDIDFECQSMTTLLGPNNHGKSNILSALEFGFSTSAKPSEEDFFTYRTDDAFWVEMVFSNLTEQERNTFKRYVRSDGTFAVRKTCRKKDGGFETAYNGWLEQPDESWLRNENASDYCSREKIAATPLKDLVSPDGRITKAMVEEAQLQYIQSHKSELKFSEELEESPFLGQKNIGGGVLPDFYLIPAIRDLTEEIKVKTTTTFGRLLSRSIQEMAESNERFKQVKDQLKGLIATLNERQETGAGNPNELQVLEQGIEEELKSWGVKVNIEVVAPDIERVFELGTDLHLDDGIRTSANRKGHGLQRAVIFALLRSWAKALRKKPEGVQELAPRKQSESVIFAMEEPELFLHPHAQRRLAASLRDISDTPEHQVFLCTHSTHFVDLAHYQEVAIVNKQDSVAGSQLRQCVAELFVGEDVAERKKQFQMAQWVNPDRAEMFFARRVVFVEGETEKVLLPYLAERLGMLDTDVSVIDCGSKHNMPLYIAIAKAFKLSYAVIHDEDPLPNPIPEDWEDDKRKAKQRTFDLNAFMNTLVDAPFGAIEILSPDFEEASRISKSQGARKGKALAALDHFSNIDVDDIPERLKQIINFAFAKAA